MSGKVVHESQLLSFAVVASDPDGDDVGYGLVDPPAGMTIDPNGILSWTPGNGTSGTYSVTVRVTDENGATDQEPVAIAVED